MEKVLITGINGFVGRNLATFLKTKGFEVRGIVRKGSKFEELINRGIELFTDDISDPLNSDAFLEGVDYVVHLATAKAGPWQEYYLSAIQGTKNLLSECTKHKIKKFIFLSSIAVYDVYENKKHFNEDSEYLKHNLTNYIRSKIEAEKICKEYSENLPLVILRPGIIIGEGQDIMIPRLGLSFGSKILVSGGKNKLPLVTIENLLEAIYLAMIKEASSGKIYNVVDDEKITQKEYLEKLMKITNLKLSIVTLSKPFAFLLAKTLESAFKLIRKDSPISRTYLMQCSYNFDYSNERIKKDLEWVSRQKVSQSLDKVLHSYKEGRKNEKEVDLKFILKHFDLGKDIKTGIVGCGMISEAHISFLKKLKNVRIIGICDTNFENAEKIAKRFGIANIYNDVNELLVKGDPDVIHILTPPQSHKDIAISAMKKGVHVLIEKPMTLDAKEAEEILEISKANNVKVCVNHTYVYDPIMIRAREIISKGMIGDVVFAESWCGANLSANQDSRYMLSGAANHWVYNLPGSLFQNFMPHPLSVLIEVIGEPNEYFVSTSKTGVVKAMETDEMHVLVKTPKATGLIVVSFGVNPRYQFFNIYGTKGSILLDFLNKTIVTQTTPKGIPKAISRFGMNFAQAGEIFNSNLKTIGKVLTKKFTPYEGTEILIRRFYLSVVGKDEVPVTGYDGFVTMKVMDKIWKEAFHV